MNFKTIHIGSYIEQKVEEDGISMEHIRGFFGCSEEEIHKMFRQPHLATDTLLIWSKALAYDFFRIYTQHMILYAPCKAVETGKNNSLQESSQFRKNIYTQEIIDFILELLATGKKTKPEIISEYRIPKTTLYRWIDKYSPLEETYERDYPQL
ncbi:MAG: transposase [Chryseobacterium sp.]|jgi:hypothetical protein|uniref:helix-turn-helix domain-containing protein n=1 Tax=Chryseobacterium sp. TaxID=1871047 RepID=UPI002834215E|nr:transposase [Chryseobacterium sp.]MDR2235262.1 transposase [Chryseobacterium sp.]